MSKRGRSHPKWDEEMTQAMLDFVDEDNSVCEMVIFKVKFTFENFFRPHWTKFGDI